MLVDFKVYNYRSFKEITEFSMIADGKEKHPAVFEEGKFNLLKSAAIYGPNAGGKSNFIRAWGIYRFFILSSNLFSEDLFPVVEKFKLNHKSLEESTIFESRFINGNFIYRYGFEVDGKKIKSEWLFRANLENKRLKEAKIFERIDQKIERGNFSEAKGVEEKTSENTLFLSSLAQWNSKLARQIVSFFKKINVIMWEFPYFSSPAQTLNLFEKGKITKEEILSFLKKADFDIVDFEYTKNEIDISKLPDLVKNAMVDANIREPDKLFNVKLYTYHNVYDKNGNVIDVEKFNFEEEESAGTKKLFNIIGEIIYALKEGKILFIDELDTQLHPTLLKAVVEFFNSEKNKNNAQLVFTTHNTSILTPKIFRKDQIWFVDKNKNGSSELYSLLEIKSVRKEANFEKEYLKGRYGAVPFVKYFLEGFDRYGKEK
ncbi:abortive infection protein [Thermosipho sp. 1063]|uniref:AAA family ATPase n=1 Tax=Thermosipho sp. 1063 TaxID=1462747 RepID=UPI000950AE7F|nr:ATP-binding protein [Thermosipho sp. 1063]APT72088.1 abortive infection protein [Thermosipho sp. 1063]